MATDHPHNEYLICYAALRLVIADPALIGEAPRKTGNFELHRRVNHPEGKVVMVAVSLEVDEGGFYRLRSSYLVAGEVVDNRRIAKRLRPPPPK